MSEACRYLVGSPETRGWNLLLKFVDNAAAFNEVAAKIHGQLRQQPASFRGALERALADCTSSRGF